MFGWALHRGHLRRQDAGRAVQRREGLVEHRHVAADGGLASRPGRPSCRRWPASAPRGCPRCRRPPPARRDESGRCLARAARGAPRAAPPPAPGPWPSRWPWPGPACTHESCSRMLTMCMKNGFRPACLHRRAEGVLVQVRASRRPPRSGSACAPGCPGGSVPGRDRSTGTCSRARRPRGRVPAAYSATALQSTMAAMLVPQWQT